MDKTSIIFCTDLDNTLIYSGKHDLGADRINVEIYKEREITFISSRTKALLEEVSSKTCLVPVTTRTVEQYERIHLGIDTPEYALTCNGGVLLVQGARDQAWYEESQRLVADCREELARGLELLTVDPARSLDVRFIEELFVFTKSEEPARTLETLRQNLDETKVDLYAQGAKIYVVPKVLNKGTAVKRFKTYLSAGAGETESCGIAAGGGGIEPYVIAAGDSRFDLPMMEVADLGLAPATLTFGETWEVADHKSEASGRIIVLSGKKLYAEEMLEYVLQHAHEMSCG